MPSAVRAASVHSAVQRHAAHSSDRSRRRAPSGPELAGQPADEEMLLDAVERDPQVVTAILQPADGKELLGCDRSDAARVAQRERSAGVAIAALTITNGHQESSPDARLTIGQ